MALQCEVCRSRKSRCDGTKPKCKLCTELGAECIYREPGIKLDAGDKLILERLNRLESLLQINLVSGHAAAAINGGPMQLTQGSPSMSNGTGLSGDLMGAAQGQNGFVPMIP